MDCQSPNATMSADFQFSDSNTPKMKGLNFVAPPRPFSQNPMPAVSDVNANWIAVIPYAYTPRQQARVIYNPDNWQQWWGERPEGVDSTITLAQAAKLQIMLKPQVYLPGSWPGALDFDSEEEWQQWEADYEAYLMPYVDLAEKRQIPLFCIGTEFKISVQKRTAFWEGLIAKIRGRYKGKLVYAANWDAYENMPLWHLLDYIGVNAYFPLDRAQTPTVKDLKTAWQTPLTKLRRFAQQHQRPIIFTEFGYLSVDGCAYNTWELEGKIQQLDINEQAQANAMTALFDTFFLENFWAGGFLWKWFPNMMGHEGYPDKDYSPQGKLGEAVLRQWYGR